MYEVQEEDARAFASFKATCPGCGANLSFDPVTGKLKCMNCGCLVDFEKEGPVEECPLQAGIMEDEQNEKKWDGTVVMNCPNCGARVILEKKRISDHCQFCSSALVADLEHQPSIYPDGVIPFSISRKEAEGIFQKWIKKHFFAPSKLKTTYTMDHLNGIYLPFYTYDSDTSTDYSADAGTYYYVTEHYPVQVNGKTQMRTRQVRHTRWRPVSGQYQQFFDDVWIPAFQSEEVDHVKLPIEHTPNHIVDYKPEYLTGFSAQLYTVKVKDGWQTAKEKIQSAITAGITNQVNADEIRDIRKETTYSNMTFKLILTALWVITYYYHGKSYTSVISGQNGKITGSYPISYVKVAVTILLGILLLLAAYFAVSWYTGH